MLRSTTNLLAKLMKKSTSNLARKSLTPADVVTMPKDNANKAKNREVIEENPTDMVHKYTHRRHNKQPG